VAGDGSDDVAMSDGDVKDAEEKADPEDGLQGENDFPDACGLRNGVGRGQEGVPCGMGTL
jgi:hypothetical protein